jgi:hypothetical protein
MAELDNISVVYRLDRSLIYVFSFFVHRDIGKGVLTLDSLDFATLIDMRCANQTHQADKGVRTKQSRDTAQDGKQKSTTLRTDIIRLFHEALKESQDDQAVGTGYERSARWTMGRVPARGARDGQFDGASAPALASGNAANAAVTAAAIVKQAAARRKTAFTNAKVPNLNDAIDARVTIFRPLKLQDYGFIFMDEGLMIGHGVCTLVPYDECNADLQ